MNKKTKILGAIIVTSVMLLLAFTGIMTHIQSRKDVNEPQAEANFVDIAKCQNQLWLEYYNPGQVLKQVYKNVGLDSSAESDFITVYNALDSKFGTNVEVYFSAPSSWQYVVSVLEGWT